MFTNKCYESGVHLVFSQNVSLRSFNVSMKDWTCKKGTRDISSFSSAFRTWTWSCACRRSGEGHLKLTFSGPVGESVDIFQAGLWGWQHACVITWHRFLHVEDALPSTFLGSILCSSVGWTRGVSSSGLVFSLAMKSVVNHAVLRGWYNNQNYEGRLISTVQSDAVRSILEFRQQLGTFWAEKGAHMSPF